MTTIRRLVADDAPTYRALRLRALAEHPQAFTSSVEEESLRRLDWSQQRLQSSAERPHDFFLGAFEASELVGMAGLAGRYRRKERHNASLVGLYVACERAGKGIGLALVQELLRQARRYPDLEQVDLSVTAGNAAAQAIYRRCGFTVYGTLDRAIQVQGRYYAKLEMVARLR